MNRDTEILILFGITWCELQDYLSISRSASPQQQVGIRSQAFDTLRMWHVVFPVALRRFFLLLLKELPIISGTKFLHNDKVPTYLLASAGSIEKSALHPSVTYSRPCLFTIYRIYYNIQKYSIFCSSFEQCRFVFDHFRIRTIETLLNKNVVSHWKLISRISRFLVIARYWCE